MVIDEKIIYVYDDFSEDSPCLIGKLYVGVIKGGETYSFEYDADWLAKNKMRVSLDPQLQPFTGRQFPTGKNIFGMFSDASPDRWTCAYEQKGTHTCWKRTKKTKKTA